MKISGQLTEVTTSATGTITQAAQTNPGLQGFATFAAWFMFIHNIVNGVVMGLILFWKLPMVRNSIRNCRGIVLFKNTVLMTQGPGHKIIPMWNISLEVN